MVFAIVVETPTSVKVNEVVVEVVCDLHFQKQLTYLVFYFNFKIYFYYYE